MNLVMVLVLSFLSILFLLVGTLIVFRTGNSEKIMTFSVALGFVVLILLGLIHLVPDAYEFFRERYSTLISMCFVVFISLFGYLVVYLLDKFGGHHREHDEEHEEGHYNHISIITCIFLVVHNFIEGISIYSATLLDYQVALMLTIGIGLHNVPLGFTLSSTYYKENSKLKTILFISFIGASYLLGALIAYLFSDIIMGGIIFGVALTLTFGMVLYIALREFLPQMLNSKDKLYRNVGIIIGIILMIITLFI